jgi:hypothetical protein
LGKVRISSITAGDRAVNHQPVWRRHDNAGATTAATAEGAAAERCNSAVPASYGSRDRNGGWRRNNRARAAAAAAATTVKENTNAAVAAVPSGGGYRDIAAKGGTESAAATAATSVRDGGGVRAIPAIWMTRRACGTARGAAATWTPGVSCIPAVATIRLDVPGVGVATGAAGRNAIVDSKSRRRRKQ